MQSWHTGVMGLHLKWQLQLCQLRTHMLPSSDSSSRRLSAEPLLCSPLILLIHSGHQALDQPSCSRLVQAQHPALSIVHDDLSQLTCFQSLTYILTSAIAR